MLREVCIFLLSTSRSTTRAGQFLQLNVVKWNLQLTNNGTKGTILPSEMFPESGLQWHPEYALFE